MAGETLGSNIENTLRQSQNNCIQILENTLQISQSINENLDGQSKQLGRINKTLDNMEVNLDESKKIVNRMSSWFWWLKFGKDKYDRIPQTHMNSERFTVLTKHKVSIGEVIPDNDDNILQESDKALDQMDNYLRVLKEQAIMQGKVLDEHNEILGDINVKAEVVDTKIKFVRKGVNKLL